MTPQLVCYAAGGGVHRRNQAALVASARRHGVATIAALGPDDLPADFRSAHQAVLAEREGAGYWLWKPRIILDALTRVPEGGLVAYVDAGADLRRGLEPLVAAAEGRDGVLFWNNYPNWQHVKRDAFVLTGTDEPRYHAARQLDAALLLLRHTPRVRAFVARWLELCTDPRLLTDQPNTCGFPDLPGFTGHRHDQALLTLLFLREQAQLDFRLYARRVKHRFIRHHRRRVRWLPIWAWHAVHDGGEAALGRLRRGGRMAWKQVVRRWSQRATSTPIRSDALPS